MSRTDSTVEAAPPAQLEALLVLLCPEPSQAARAAAYEHIHGKLVDIFRWRGLPDPASLADETLDRVGRRAAEGLDIDRTPTAYVLGVARLVALEAGRRAKREVALAAPEQLPAPLEDAEVELRARALEACLAKLTEEERRVVLEYHRGEGKARIEGRQALAASLGTNVPNLRVRVFRLRARLERCVKSRLADDMERGAATRGTR